MVCQGNLAAAECVGDSRVRDDRSFRHANVTANRRGSEAGVHSRKNRGLSRAMKMRSIVRETDCYLAKVRFNTSVAEVGFRDFRNASLSSELVLGLVVGSFSKIYMKTSRSCRHDSHVSIDHVPLIAE